MWEYDRPDINWVIILERVLGFQVYQVSLFNLACISLERVHATFRPFKHRFIKKWVYAVIIMLTWLVPVVINSITSALLGYSYDYVHSKYLKVHCICHHQNHGTHCLRERKLTRTLFFCHPWIFSNVLTDDSILGPYAF